MTEKTKIAEQSDKETSAGCVVKHVPYKYKCGTQAKLGDIIEYDQYRGILYWSEYLHSFEVSCGTGLTLCEGHKDDFNFISRGPIVENPYT